jgi:hypothetical protein
MSTHRNIYTSINASWKNITYASWKNNTYTHAHKYMKKTNSDKMVFLLKKP